MQLYADEKATRRWLLVLLVGRARFELATNGLKEVMSLQNPILINP